MIYISVSDFQRLAEGLDAEVKRWSSGKQGNLRALLSTLQYVCIIVQFMFNLSNTSLCYVLIQFLTSDMSFFFSSSDSWV